MSPNTIRINATSLFVALLVGQFLIFSSIGLLPDTLTTSSYERLTAQIIPYELLSSLLCIGFSVLLVFWTRYSIYFLVLTLILLTFILFNIANVGDPSNITLFLGIIACHLAGGILAQHNRISSISLVIWAAGTFIVLFGISLYHVLNDSILYLQRTGLKPTFPGYIVSTELSNIAGLAIISIFFWRQMSFMKIIPNLMMFFSIALCIWFMSAGTILALIAIGIVANNRKTFFRSIYSLVGMCLALVLPFYVMFLAGVFDSLWFLSYLDDSVFLRIDMYIELFETGIANQLSGIGLGNFHEPPHHNFLGLWAETGLVSAMIYITYSILGLITSYKRIEISHHDEHVKLILAALFFSALFIFFKGFVHDTWQNKLFYFAIGYVTNKL